MLTVKSDDIRGRLKTYERIVKGQNLSDPGVPESFRVLVKELQGLGLDVEISYDDGSRGELVYEEEEEYFPRSGRGKRERAEESPVRRMEDMFINTGENDAIEKDNEGESVFFEDVQDPKEGADE
jgi:DNA-directed RNA polymerase subunit beta